MEKELTELYYDPVSGFVSASALHKKLKGKYALNQIKDFIDRQETKQLHKTSTKKAYYPIIGELGTFQADLTFYDKYAKSNSGYSSILTVIDINSRKAYARPLKQKTGAEVKKAFEEIIEEAGGMKVVGMDGGSEFKGDFQAMLKKHGISFYVSDPGDKAKMGMIERFNRTLRERIEKYLTAYKTNRWVDALPLLVKNYNNTVHSRTKLAPNDVTRKQAHQIHADGLERTSALDDSLPIFRVGDTVRVLKPKEMFEKGASEKYYRGVYTISKVNPMSYKVKNEAGVELKKTVKHYEVQPAERVQTHHVEKPQDREKEVKAYKVDRALKKEGVDRGNIVPSRREALVRLARQGIDVGNVVEGKRRRG